MVEKIQCKECDSMILPLTAERNNGLCAPCKRKMENAENTPSKPSFRGKFDDASWHYGGDFPAELPNENGATHIGMFLAWIIKNDLIGEDHLHEVSMDIENVINEKITGRDFFIKNCDEKLCEDDLNGKGNDFAHYYYQTNLYNSDYDTALANNLKSAYHVEDSWSNYHILSPYIQKQFEKWSSSNKTWWQFWK